VPKNNLIVRLLLRHDKFKYLFKVVAEVDKESGDAQHLAVIVRLTVDADQHPDDVEHVRGADFRELLSALTDLSLFRLLITWQAGEPHLRLVQDILQQLDCVLERVDTAF
jgi:hypothetical protein